MAPAAPAGTAEVGVRRTVVLGAALGSWDSPSRDSCPCATQ